MNAKTIVAVANYTMSAACLAMIGLTAYCNHKQKQIDAETAKLQNMMKPKQTCCNAPYAHETNALCWL